MFSEIKNKSLAQKKQNCSCYRNLKGISPRSPCKNGPVWSHSQHFPQLLPGGVRAGFVGLSPLPSVDADWSCHTQHPSLQSILCSGPGPVCSNSQNGIVCWSELISIHILESLENRLYVPQSAVLKCLFLPPQVKFVKYLVALIGMFQEESFLPSAY